MVIYYSLVDNPISNNFVFLDNFKNIIGNASFRTAVRNTFTFAVVAVPLAVVLSLLLAIVLEAKLPFRSQFRTFSESDDGARGIYRVDLAGALPL